jgi:hypothetical protein
MNIELDPEIARIYQANQAVSGKSANSFILLSILTFFSFIATVNKGISSNLMKMTAQRRRSKRQIQEEKEAEEARKADTEQKLS